MSSVAIIASIIVGKFQTDPSVMRTAMLTNSAPTRKYIIAIDFGVIRIVIITP